MRVSSESVIQTWVLTGGRFVSPKTPNSEHKFFVREVEAGGVREQQVVVGMVEPQAGTFRVEEVVVSLRNGHGQFVVGDRNGRRSV